MESAGSVPSLNYAQRRRRASRFNVWLFLRVFIWTVLVAVLSVYGFGVVYGIRYGWD